jgi:hypothetical protein
MASAKLPGVYLPPVEEKETKGQGGSQRKVATKERKKRRTDEDLVSRERVHINLL